VNASRNLLSKPNPRLLPQTTLPVKKERRKRRRNVSITPSNCRSDGMASPFLTGYTNSMD
jgi:hypothetical protein